MTERHEITTMLQKEFSRLPAVFGELLQGSEEEPAVVKESVHHFSKQVSGAPIKRPAWFFDVAQQGEGLVDITTHLVDLVQWECCPGAILDFARDIRILGAKRWPTVITSAQFQQVARLERFPEFLRNDVHRDGDLHVYANGEIDYRIKGVHAKVRVLWNFEAPEGAGDAHYSVMRGSNANLVIRQGATEATGRPSRRTWRKGGRGGTCRRDAVHCPCAQRIPASMRNAQATYGARSGVVSRRPRGILGRWRHSSSATPNRKRFPDWEVPNMTLGTPRPHAPEIARAASPRPSSLAAHERT
jgi:hypothetical protein